MAGFGAFGVISAANARSDDVQRIEGLELVLTAQDGPAQNYLLIGSDTRENADPNDPDFGGIGDTNEVSGRRSDTIMILRQEADGNGASIVSLPRDLWVNIAGRDGANRINSAYSDGTDVLAATITQELGIPINHVVDIDFNGFKDIVDAVGGTEVCFWYATRDKNTGLDQQPGCHTAQRDRGAPVRPQPLLRGVPRRRLADRPAHRSRADRASAELPPADGRCHDRSTPVRSVPRVEADRRGDRAVRMDPGLDPVAAAGTLRKAFSAGSTSTNSPSSV